MIKYSFAPIIDKNSKILLLGTMPGNTSLSLKQYFSDPSNDFWNLIYSVFDDEPNSDYNTRIQFLLKNRFAIWDVLEYCDREGSLDRKIKNGHPNDFNKFYMNFPEIEYVLFNGSCARDLYTQYIGFDLIPKEYCFCLPSSSSSLKRNPKLFYKRPDIWKSRISKILDNK